MTRAIFINRTTAYLAAQEAAIRSGYTEEQANSETRVYPVYRRGEMQGWEAWYPNGGCNSPVLEA